MRVMVIVKATRSSESGELPSQELLEAMGKYNEELVNAGIMVSGEGLKPSAAGVRVRFSGTNRVVTEGPFTETNEVIAGYWMWNVKSLDEAVAWAKRCPNPMPEDSDLEIRPVFEADDFGEAFTPELREQEAALRAKGLGLGDLTYRAGEPGVGDAPRYAVFRHAGPASNLPATHAAIRERWAPECGLKLAPADPVERPSPDGTEIWVPLQG